MKTLKRSASQLALALLVVVTIGLRSVLADPIVSIQPPLLERAVGSFFDVFVDIAAATDVFSYQFDISFDPAILSAVSIDEGTFLSAGGATFFIPGVIDNNTGTISFTADSLIGAVAGVNGGGKLAAINFQALAVGASPVEFVNITLLDSGLGDIAFSTITGTVNVTSVNGVPEPSGLLLIVVGVLAGIASRKQSQGVIVTTKRFAFHLAMNGLGKLF